MNRIKCEFDIESSKLSCELPASDFRKIKDLNKEIRYYKKPNFVPKLSEVAIKAERTIKLKDIKAIKNSYFIAYQELIEAIKTKRKLKSKTAKKRVIKLAAFFMLFISIMSVSILSQPKDIKLIVDGEIQETQTNQFITSLYADKVAEKNNFEEYEVTCSDDFSIKDQSVINLSSLKTIKVQIDGKTKEIETFENDVDAFIKENETNLLKGKNAEKYSLYYKSKGKKKNDILLKDVEELNLYYLSKKTKTKKVEKPHRIKYVENAKLDSGTKKIKQKGKDSIYIKEYVTTYLNDKKHNQKVVTKKVVQKGQAEIIEIGTKVSASTSSVWDRLAKCESGGRWNLNTGNGFYGGVQFSAPTWRTAAAKVGVSAPYAHLASKEEQIKAATWLQKNSGWGQWPHCSSKLGLR